MIELPGFYKKSDVAGLTIHSWTSFADFRKQLTQDHCMISSRVFHHLHLEDEFTKLFDPVPKHHLVLRGLLGYIRDSNFTTPILCDAYSRPGSDERIFGLPDTGFFILIPKDRQLL